MSLFRNGFRVRSSRSQRSNAERSLLPRLLALLLLAGSVGFGLVGCDLGGAPLPPDPIAVEGVWQIVGSDWDGDGNANVERWTITDSSIHYESTLDGTTYTTTYRADIVEFSNDSLNGGDTALTSGGSTAPNPGYAVITYTEVDNAGTGEVGKYNVFRWAQNTTTPSNRDFSQGFKDADGASPYVNDLFDTPEAAKTGATNSAGYFAFASTGAEKVE